MENEDTALTPLQKFKDPSLIETRGLIGGKWVNAASGKYFTVVGVFSPGKRHDSHVTGH